MVGGFGQISSTTLAKVKLNPYQSVVRRRRSPERNAAPDARPDGTADVVGREADVLDAGAAVLRQVLLDVRIPSVGPQRLGDDETQGLGAVAVVVVVGSSDAELGALPVLHGAETQADVALYSDALLEIVHPAWGERWKKN